MSGLLLFAVFTIYSFVDYYFHLLMLFKGLTTLFSCFVFMVIFAQEPIEEPTWPHHGYEDQMKAIPSYNEACELYKNGDTLGTLISLREAVTISFALTEAQLFLAKVYEDKGEWEKALVYYNSGIDFEIRQKPHFYFKLFNLGMRFGEYDMIKHNMKHFKKLFGTKPVDQYQEGWNYGIQDWEYIRESIALVYNFRNWQSEFDQVYVDSISAEYLVSINDQFSIHQNAMKIMHWDSKRRNFKNKKAISLPDGEVNNPSFSRDSKYIVFDREGDIYFARQSGKNWSEPIKLIGEINSAGWDGQPHLNNAGDQIYFVSDRKGSKDIYVAKINLETAVVEKAVFLDQSNSFRDEQFPRFNEDETVFYFSSNGFPGFGGFDVFWTKDYEILDGVKKPIDPVNMKAGVNSKDDELFPVYLDNKLLIKRKSIEGDETLHFFEQKTPVKMVEFELEMNGTEVE